jgi:hypothetical protein
VTVGLRDAARSTSLLPIDSNARAITLDLGATPLD